MPTKRNTRRKRSRTRTRTRTPKQPSWNDLAKRLCIAPHLTDKTIWYAHVESHKTAYCEIQKWTSSQIADHLNDIAEATTAIYVRSSKGGFDVYTIVPTIDTTGKEWAFTAHTFSKDDGSVLPESVRAGAYGAMMCKV